MRHILAATFLVCSGGITLAQNSPSPPANQNPSMPAVSTTNRNNSGAPAAGANSFTEAQAKSRMEGAGYANVTKLVKDKDGVWRGKGTKAGKSMDLSLDYQGNILAK